MKTGNTRGGLVGPPIKKGPQWSPVMKTGNTRLPFAEPAEAVMPQWSPVMKTGNTGNPPVASKTHREASMEPGHEDREYSTVVRRYPAPYVPQWSPVMKTGNTGRAAGCFPAGRPRLNGARS